MTISEEDTTRDPARRPFWRRLVGQAALGAAGAIGSAFVTGLLWWLRAR
ncbi:hypothetical protein [Streptomyces geranii]|nr:hypothetical protein [Streptomyces geranii]